ncbi:PAS domain protein [Leptospira alexanderi serovar Manhao 3 str. L 60]|uniref:PAS domain protein n=1 Tax=Leptospira alexanderi serovar Manhao 3 str. L 60 TaxID=1049759 RepID=V6HVB4_9LEPT|nr:PAS domain protein [Leptospira alexanderi serovar Manhao 3 str. L 60]
MNLSSILISYFYQYPHAMFITNRCGMIEYINPVFETLSGYNRNELIGKNPRLFQAGVHDPNFYEELWKTILSGKEYEGNFLNRNGSGKQFPGKKELHLFGTKRETFQISCVEWTFLRKMRK